MKCYITLLMLIFSVNIYAQNGTVKGKVVDEVSKEPVPFANIIVQGTNTGTSTNMDGEFTIEGTPLGYIRLEVSAVGFKKGLSEDLYVTNNKSPFIEIQLEKLTTELKEIVVESSAFEKSEESPVSLQTIGIEEIERNPGGNRDISKAIQSLPGVASLPGFRNDIVIRGGAPSENVFYIDGVATPIINHFQTQGSSGGPVGMLNINLIREVNLYSGAFPANRGNTLSSVMEIKQIEGNKDKSRFRGTIGSSDIGLTADGPLGKKTNYIFSVRRSYLQFLFAALKLPFLPTYTDAQFKVKHRFNDKNELTFIGLGALDEFELNESVNDGVTDVNRKERNDYFLGNVPINGQWNYTLGAVYKHYGKKGFQTVVLSRNFLNNTAYKHPDNNTALPRNFDYKSTEAENKLRLENTIQKEVYKFNYGVDLQNARYTNETFNTIQSPVGAININFSSTLDLLKYGFWGQVSRGFLENRLSLSFGLRMDGTDYNDDMSNPLSQLSPRLSVSYSLTDRWSLNFNTGRYYQLPAYTILGYRDNSKELVNKNRTKFIQVDHLVGGVQFDPDNSTKITVEGFYKNYQNYPFSLRDSISLANLGADFGVIGNEPVNSTSEGRAYGAELLIQRRSRSGLFGILAFTWVNSEFKDRNGDYIASSWDSRQILSLTAGKKFKKNFEVGLKWRYSGGLPYTPYNESLSALRSNWDAKGRGIRDYSQLNSRRLGVFHQLDIRIDKTWFYKKIALNMYVDIQNLYNFKSDLPDILFVRQDDNGNRLIDPNDSSRYQTYRIKNESGTVVPTVGVIIDF